MPTLSHHQSNRFTKMLLMGDSGSGKTGALTSLVAVGYQLRILDYDNGLETLKQYVARECPEKADNVEFRTLRDKRKASPLGSIVAGTPKAFVDGLKLLDRWKYKTDQDAEVDLGVPAEWGEDTILVLDTMTFMAQAAFDWAEPLVPTGRSGEKDNRAVYGMAQRGMENVLQLLTSDGFECNVIVNSHVRWIERQDGMTKGYPTVIGQALSENVPRYFNSVALAQTDQGGKRTIQTAATALIDLKNPKPFEMLPNFPIETGLADFFGTLRKHPSEYEDHKPNSKLTQRKLA